MAKIVPDTNQIRSMCNQTLSWKTALSEWIDNSLDAGANQIRIALDNRKSCTVTDDGCGAPDVLAVVSPGRSKAHKTTKLGRYGVGGIDAALWVGGEKSKMVVDSTCNGSRSVLSVDWQALIDKGEWEIPDPEVHAFSAGLRSGTKIHVAPTRALPSGECWSDLVADLGYIYSRAIRSGCQILISGPATKHKDVPLKPWELPKLKPGHIDTTIQVRGHDVRVVCGIVEDGVPNTRIGLTYYHNFRAIVSASSNGCGGHNAARIAGYVDVGSGWALDKNKNGLGPRADELYDAVEAACESVLVQADSIGYHLETSALQNKISDRLNAVFAGLAEKNRKAVRHKQNSAKTGTVEATGKGSGHTKAAKTQRGQTFSERLSNASLRLVFVEMTGDIVGEVMANGTIALNDSLAGVRKAKEQGNEHALTMCCFALLADHFRSQEPGGQQTMKMIRGFEKTNNISADFCKNYGVLLASQTALNGVVQ